MEGGALSYLVTLLYRKAKAEDARVVNSTIRRAIETITNLARDNSNIQKRLRYLTLLSILLVDYEYCHCKEHVSHMDLYW